MFEGMDTTSYGHGGFVATQDTAERKSFARTGRGSAFIPVLTKDVRDLLPGQEHIRRGTFESAEVTFVGIIRSAERKFNAAGIDYYVDDNTGPPLLVNQFIEEERDGNTIPVAENTYVRVFGKVRTWGNQRGVTGFAIVPLKNLNELTMHILEVTHCKLFFGKDILRRHEERANNKTPSAGAGTGTGAMAATANYGATSKSMPAAAISSGLTGMNGEIHKFLSTTTSESGYSVADINRRFPQFPIPKIREQLELLSSEGHVYTTVDDDHYRTTDS